jgi:hypothetical protein
VWRQDRRCDADPDEGPACRRWVGTRGEECGREDDSHERGWKAYLADGDREFDVVVIFCPACARREFGDPEGGTFS